MGLMVAGLFAMHGLQATDGPMATHGVPLMSAHGGHAQMAPAAEAGPRPAHEKTGAALAQAMAGSPEKAGSGRPSPDSPASHHPGGRMCLGLLIVASLLILLTVLIRRSRLVSSRCRRRDPALHEYAGRPPPTPSIFTLSVLRL